MELQRLTTVSFRTGRRGGGFDLIGLADHCASICGADTGKNSAPEFRTCSILVVSRQVIGVQVLQGSGCRQAKLG